MDKLLAVLPFAARWGGRAIRLAVWARKRAKIQRRINKLRREAERLDLQMEMER